MSAREVVVLGTASQVPTRQRSHHSLFLRWDDLGVLFDPGEGTQRQMAFAGIAASQITHVCITHFHGDHCLGLASICQRISLDEVAHPVEILFPETGLVYYERLRRASIYHDRSDIVARPIPVPDGGETVVLESGDVTLSIAPLEHRLDCFGYRLKEKDGRRMLPDKLGALGIRGPHVGELMAAGSLDVGGRRVTVEEVSELRRGQVFAFVMDTRPCEGARTLARGADLLVCESTYLESESEEAHAHYHMTASQAGLLAREAGARRLLLTHFSQRYGHSSAFAAEARAHHDDVVAAEDLLLVPVPKRQV